MTSYLYKIFNIRVKISSKQLGIYLETTCEAACNTSSRGCDLEILLLLCSYFLIQGSTENRGVKSVWIGCRHYS